jgi:hypothetical protein
MDRIISKRADEPLGDRIFALMIAAGVAVFAAYLASGFGQYFFWYGGPPPLYGEIASLAVFVGALFIVVVTGQLTDLSLSRTTIVAWAALLACAVLTIISFVYSSQSEVAVELLVTRVKSFLFLAVLTLLFMKDDIRAAFAYAAVALAVFCSLLNVADFFQPMMSVVPGRAAGFYLNPNDSALMLVALGIVAATRLNVLGNYLLWSAVSAGTVLTFSRSGWLILVIALMFMAYYGKLGSGRARILFVSVVALVITLLFVSLLSGDLYYFVANSPLANLLDPNTIARLGASGSAIDDYSTQERNDVAWFGIQAFLDSPILGNGLAHTHEWRETASTHNMLILQMAEQGILGLITYGVFMVALVVSNRGLGFALAVVLGASGMFNHNQFDSLFQIVVIAFAMATGARHGSFQVLPSSTYALPRPLNTA